MKYQVLAALLATTICATANAATVQYEDRAQFLAASGAPTVETFGAGPPSAFSFQVGGSGGSSASIGSGVLSANLTGSTASPGTLTFTFAAPIFSFGADFSSLNNNSARTYVNVGGTTFDPLPLDPAFLGFVSDISFTTVTFLNPLGGIQNDRLSLDNLTFASSTVTAAVPEPATWAMMIAGFGLVGGAMRRRSTKIAFA